jgi:hypothetical protein
MPENSASRRWGNIYLACLLLVTIGLRLSGIFWGIPPFDTGYYHPDEPKLVWGAYRFPDEIVDRLDLRYPTGLHALAGALTWPAKKLVETQGSDSYKAVYLGGRVISVLMGTATVLLVYLLARKRYGQVVGLAAATGMAFSLLHVTNSSWLTTDVATSFYLALFLLLVVITLERRSIWWALAAGVSLGLLVGTKYTGALAMLPLAILVFASHRPAAGGSLWRSLLATLTDPRLWAIGIAAGLVYLASTPATLAHPKAFLLSLRQEQERLALDRLPLYRLENWSLAIHSTIQAMGLPLALAALLGLVLSLFRRGAFELALSALVAAFYITSAMPCCPVILSSSCLRCCCWQLILSRLH